MAGHLLTAHINGLIHRSDEDRVRYNTIFRSKPLTPTFRHFPEAYLKYGIAVYDLLYNLGWSSSIPSFPTLPRPEPVRIFYSNLRLISTSPFRLETQVFGHRITITPALIATVLSSHTYGLSIHTYPMLVNTGFDLLRALQALHIPLSTLSSPLSITCLPPRLRVLHFFITRHFIPRTFDQDLLYPLDIWVLYHAVVTQHPLSLPHFFMQTLLDAAQPDYPGKLPLGSFITALLLKLKVDLEFTLTDSVVHYLRPQHVLRTMTCSTISGGLPLFQAFPLSLDQSQSASSTAISA
ncbi:hypothetical protein LINPERHAP1_LOCUS32586 [Linum perenne]